MRVDGSRSQEAFDGHLDFRLVWARVKILDALEKVFSRLKVGGLQFLDAFSHRGFACNQVSVDVVAVQVVEYVGAKVFYVFPILKNCLDFRVV